jgi:hypothetical protein
MVKPVDVPVECVKDLVYVNSEGEEVVAARKGRRYALGVHLISADGQRFRRFLFDDEFKYFEVVGEDK